MTEIVERAVRNLIPYARNPRENDAVVDQMAASVREFGFKVPILALSDGTIADGHLRLKTAQKLKIEMVPVILCDEWTPAQVKTFRLMANKSVSWAEWDEELLRFEMEELKSPDFDHELTGFGDDEPARIMEPAQIEGLTDPDSVPDLPSDPVTVPGDLWILGKHRLMCGELIRRWIVSRMDFSGDGELPRLRASMERVLPTATQGASFWRGVVSGIAAILKSSSTMASESF
jgi:ParB-like chromosome segregation protein Spo0J